MIFTALLLLLLFLLLLFVYKKQHVIKRCVKKNLKIFVPKLHTCIHLGAD